jgi:hypothetical protein
VAREIGVRMRLDASQTVDESARVATGLEAVKEETASLGRELDATKRDAEEYTAAMVVAKEETASFGSKARSTADDVKGLDARIKEAKASVGQMSIAFNQSSSDTNRKNLDDAKKALATLQQTRRDIMAFAASQPAEEAAILYSAGIAKNVEGGIRRGAEEGAGGLGEYLIPAAVVLAPMLGSVISGAIVGTVAGVGIAGGIASAAKQPAVQAAFKQFLAQGQADFFGGSSSSLFVGPIEAGLNILKTDLENAHIGDALSKAAPAVTILADGIGRLVDNLMPGFNAVLDKSVPLTQVFATGLEETGTALSTFLKEIVSSPGGIEGLSDAFSGLDKAIVGVGYGLHYLGDAYDISKKFNTGFGATLLAAVDPAQAAKLPDTYRALAAKNSTVSIGGSVQGAIGSASAAAEKQAAATRAYALAGENAAAASQNQAKALELLTRQYDLATDATLKMKNADLDVAQGWIDIKTAVDQGTRGFNNNTQTGVDNQRMIYGQIQALEAQRDEQIKNSDGSTAALKKINDQYNANLQVLEDYAAKLGALPAQIKAIDNLKATAYVNVVYTPGVGPSDLLINKHASGGYDPGGRPYLAGENGPELIWPAGPTYVDTAAQTRTFMGQAGGGGSNLTISFDPSAVRGADSQIIAAVLQGLRFTVDKRFAGNSQTALSRR